MEHVQDEVNREVDDAQGLVQGVFLDHREVQLEGTDPAGGRETGLSSPAATPIKYEATRSRT